MFFEIVSRETQDNFKTNLDKLLNHLSAPGAGLVDDNVRSLFFGDYMVPGADPRIYDEITDFEQLTLCIERYIYTCILLPCTVHTCIAIVILKIIIR